MVGISDLLDSDAGYSRDGTPEQTLLSNTLTDPIRKPRRKRRNVTMPPRAKSKVAKTAAEKKRPATKRATAAKRKAIEEDVDEVADEEGDEIQETQAPSPKPRARANAKRAASANDESNEQSEDDAMEVDQTPIIAQSSHAPARGRKTVPKPMLKGSTATTKSKTTAKLPETAIRQDTLVGSEDEDEMQLAEKAVPKMPSRATSRTHANDTFRRRAGSASDTERGDPNLRRKLGDVTRKFENVDLKYRNLREVGLNEANANMEKLRKQCEGTTQASSDLVASLKKELAQQAPLVQESRKLKKQVQTNELELVELRKASTTISTNLASAQNEIKTLQAKLAAARSSSVAAETHPTKQPGSALKHQMHARSGSVHTSESAFVAQMKEELYRDLTGLILRGVKRSEEGDTYDCIQTGRNGSK